MISNLGEYLDRAHKRTNVLSQHSRSEWTHHDPYGRAINAIESDNIPLMNLLSNRLLTDEEQALYEKRLIGPEAFGITSGEFERHRGESTNEWKAWSQACTINNFLVGVVCSLKERGEIPPSIRAMDLSGDIQSRLQKIDDESRSAIESLIES